MKLKILIIIFMTDIGHSKDDSTNTTQGSTAEVTTPKCGSCYGAESEKNQ